MTLLEIALVGAPLALTLAMLVVLWAVAARRGRQARRHQLEAGYQRIRAELYGALREPSDDASADTSTIPAKPSPTKPPVMQGPKLSRPDPFGLKIFLGDTPTSRVIGFKHRVAAITHDGAQPRVEVIVEPIFAAPTPGEISAGLARLQAHANGGDSTC